MPRRFLVFKLLQLSYAMHFAPLLALLLARSPDKLATRQVGERISAAPSSFFVTVDGSNIGNGSAAAPWSLSTALIQPGIVRPGDTIWLHGGTYHGSFTSRLSGTPGLPIVLRQYPGERAVIDGALRILGHHALYWGFEIMYSARDRVTALSGSSPADVPGLGMTLFVSGAFNKLINLVVHDLSDGLFAGSPAEGLEVYGCIFYNNGWAGPDRGHGHNVYLQNEKAAKVVADNVLFDSFSSGLQIYGTSAAYLRNFDIEGNTIFGSGDPVASRFGAAFDIEHWGGAPGGLGHAIYRHNSIYSRDARNLSVRLNAPGEPAGEDIEFSDNIVHGQTHFNEMRRYIVTGNKFTSGAHPLLGQSVLIALRMPPGVRYSSYTWDNNQYAVPALSTQDPFHIVDKSNNGYAFSSWQATTGYDRNSRFV